MKKLVLLCLVMGSYSSCKKAVVDPLASCEKASEAFSAATSDYFANINDVKKCQAFVSSAQNLLKNCPTLNLADKKAAEASIASVKCSN
jgi:hypothetical protein